MSNSTIHLHFGTVDEVANAIETATNDMLIRPDWNANMAIVDLLAPIARRDILAEVVFLLRKKLKSPTPQVTLLTLHLLEGLVKNLPPPHFFEALNDPKFTSDMCSVARKYSVKSTSSDQREVGERVLDIIQGWGEAFLPRRATYPHLVEMYFTLRKEGLPFKVNNQFDPSRVPIFSSGGSGRESGRFIDSHTDGLLAAAIDANTTSSASRRQSSSRADTMRNSSNANYTDSNSPSPLPASAILDTLEFSLPLLKDLAAAATSESELTGEVAGELVRGIERVVAGGRVESAIEGAMHDAELLCRLIALNDEAQEVLRAFGELERGRLSLSQLQRRLNPPAAESAPVSRPSPIAIPAASHSVMADPPSPLIDVSPGPVPSRAGGGGGGWGTPTGTQRPLRSSPREAHTDSPSSIRTPQRPPLAPSANPSPAAMPSTGIVKPIPLLAPPPAPSSTLSPPAAAAGRAQSARLAPVRTASSDTLLSAVVTAPLDPFAPEALDALFETKPKASSSNVPPSLPPPRPQAPASNPRDPFSPEALDALFAPTKPSNNSNSNALPPPPAAHNVPPAAYPQGGYVPYPPAPYPTSSPNPAPYPLPYPSNPYAHSSPGNYPGAFPPPSYPLPAPVYGSPATSSPYLPAPYGSPSHASYLVPPPPAPHMLPPHLTAHSTPSDSPSSQGRKSVRRAGAGEPNPFDVFG
eukprot:gene24842-30018_t